jgi:sugar lactone lactonase YvrE
LAVLGASVALALALAPAAQAKPGDIYVADLNSEGIGGGSIFRFGPGGGSATPVAHTVTLNPSGLILDASGQLLTTEYGLDPRIWRANPKTGAISSFLGAPPLSQPTDLARAPDGAILVSDRDAGPGGTGAVLRVDPKTKAVTTVAAGPPLNDVRGLVARRDGVIFVADSAFIYRVDPGGSVTPLVSDLVDADGLAITPDERHLFVADYGPDQIVKIDTATGAHTNFGSTIPNVGGVATLPSREVLAAALMPGVIERIPAIGGPFSLFSSDSDLAEPHGMVVEPARCGGKLPTVLGTDIRDVIDGSKFADVISTLGGRDTVRGLKGNDIVCGGAGPDTLIGGKGKDKLIGGKGRDELKP